MPENTNKDLAAKEINEVLQKYGLQIHQQIFLVETPKTE